ncbi:MAG: type II toxin-antitoxin system VapC family toxin [Calothrix sp. CSU_2_0]|nr:type II toxin-antitoxin system VapC family toxin [Calothrix sp. CSU_2_0]
MKVEAILETISKVFIDTAPVIYYIEGSTSFFPVVDVFFQGLLSRSIKGIVSPVTLTECLVMPVRLKNAEVQQSFVDFLTNTKEIEMVNIDTMVGRQAAELRVNYGLKLPDALQLAVAIRAGCDVFLTNDADLKRVTELQIVVLGQLEI